MQTPPPNKAFSAPIYQWQEGVENLEAYRGGGYHPAHIGDLYHGGRYEIIHKLGFGTYSTVWLARDHALAKNVALKILTAGSSSQYAQMETKVLRALAAKRHTHPGHKFVSSLLDEFLITGPNGTHFCIVSEAAGCSVAQSKEASLTWMFPIPIARAIAAQALLGLEYIHSCGVVHADLHSNNILFKTSALETLSVADLYRRLGEPQKLPVTRLDKALARPEAPAYCVPPATQLFTSAEDIADARILIADFGESFFVAPENNDKKNDTRTQTEAAAAAVAPAHKTELHTPVLLLPPEYIFRHEDERHPLTQAIDVWTLGCTLYEILGDGTLFEGFMPDEDHVVAEMISTLGDLPQRWWDRWAKRGDFFDEDKTWRVNTRRAHAPYSRPLAERLAIMGREVEEGEGEGEGEEEAEEAEGGKEPGRQDGEKIARRELEALEGLLRAMLAFEPAQRITAGEAVRSKWMADWGVPALRKTGVEAGAAAEETLKELPT